jgi:hypothetical protein
MSYGHVINHLPFSTKRRMDAAFKVLTKAMEDEQKRVNDREKVIALKSDDGGQFSTPSNQIVSVRCYDRKQFIKMMDVKE